jgi:predicted anti-sigma-YlaC factor YlaD
MKLDAHEQARQLIACAGAEERRASEQDWLQSHLESCASCREYAQAAGQLVRMLHAIPLAADRTLVRSTQMRVRARARELRLKRERVILVACSCALVALSSALTTPLIWRGFEWLGQWNHTPNPVWQTGFLLFWVAPTIAAGVLLLAHGTHLTSGDGASRP